jgi:hypothetical protein
MRDRGGGGWRDAGTTLAVGWGPAGGAGSDAGANRKIHRLHTIAPARKQKPGVLMSEGLLSILVPQMPGKLAYMGVKTSHNPATTPLKIHSYPHIKHETSFLAQHMR